MHSEPMHDSEGTFGEELQSYVPCPVCRQHTVHLAAWDSNCGGFTDWRYRCECGHTWWVDGVDS